MIDGKEPVTITYFNDGSVNGLGLTKREYFAAMAMQGLLASYSYTENPMPAYAAKIFVEYADALINELNKQP